MPTTNTETVVEAQADIDIADSFPDAPDLADDLETEEGVKELTEEKVVKEPGEVAEEKLEPKTKFTLKVKGVDEEVELTQAEVAAEIQKARYADQRFAEAGMVEKQSKDLYKLFQENPFEALKAMGHDPEKLSEQVVYAKAKRALMSAEDRHLSSLEEEVAALRVKDQQSAEALQQIEVAEIEKGIAKEIDDCLTANKLPLARELRKQLVRYMLEADDLGYTDVKPQDILEFAVNDYKASLGELFAELDSTQVIDFLGSQLTDKLRKHDIEKAKKPFTTVVSKLNQAVPSAKTKAAPRHYDAETFLKSL